MCCVFNTGGVCLVHLIGPASTVVPSILKLHIQFVKENTAQGMRKENMAVEVQCISLNGTKPSGELPG